MERPIRIRSRHAAKACTKRSLVGLLAVTCLAALLPSQSAADGFYVVREDVDAVEFVDISAATTTAIVTIDDDLGPSTTEIHGGMALLPSEHELILIRRAIASPTYGFLKIDICTGTTTDLGDALAGESIEGIAQDPTTGTIYVSHSTGGGVGTSNILATLNPSTLAITDVCDTTKDMDDLFISPAGQLYAVDHHTQQELYSIDKADCAPVVQEFSNAGVGFPSPKLARTGEVIVGFDAVPDPETLHELDGGGAPVGPPIVNFPLGQSYKGPFGPIVPGPPSTCGDGLIEVCEECDDGGTVPGDGCDEFCQIEEFSCCDDETESCNSDAACTTGLCCGPGRCNVEGIVAVCDALGAPCATNGDCGVEECCDDDPCGNGLPVDDEECDAGGSGCNPDAPGQCCESQCDSATCSLLGQCTDTSECCRDASECGAGIGCCGDGALDPGESCDDGNLDDGDCCSSTCTVPAGCLPACPGVGGAHLLQAASMKAKFDDKNKDDPGKDGDGKYERWKIGKRGQNGDFNLDPGQHTDCRSEEMEISIIENDGSDGVRELGSFIIPPAVWDKKKPTLADDGSVTADDQCKLSDRDELKSVPPGVSKAQWREKGVKVKYRFQGKLLGEIDQPTSFVEPSPGEDPEGQIRICVRVGASAGHSVLSCTLRKGGEQLKCQSDN